MSSLLAISVAIDPNIVDIGGLTVSWHGVFTAVAIVAGVWLAARVASGSRVNIDPDTVYTLAMVVVFAGIVGARALYVVERYGDSSSLDSVGDIFRLNEGGISIYGAIIGGAAAGWAYGLWKRLPCAAGADAAAFGMLLGLAIGRIGDLINGEHFAKVSDLPWAVRYTSPESPAFGREPMHPAVAYELIGDLVILGILAFLWRYQPKGGVVFAFAFLLYAVMRFFVSFLRLDSKEVVLGLSTPEVISLLVVAVSAPLLVYFATRKADHPFLRPATGQDSPRTPRPEL